MDDSLKDYLTHLYRIPPGNFWAGRHPQVMNPALTEERIGFLLRSGVRVIIDLTCAYECELDTGPTVNYETRVRTLAEETGGDIEYHRVPVEVLGCPSLRQIRDILVLVDTSTASMKHVFLHCLNGVDRTGTVVACYLAWQNRLRGLDYADVVALFREYSHDSDFLSELCAHTAYVAEFMRHLDDGLLPRSQCGCPRVAEGFSKICSIATEIEGFEALQNRKARIDEG